MFIQAHSLFELQGVWETFLTHGFWFQFNRYNTVHRIIPVEDISFTRPPPCTPASMDFCPKNPPGQGFSSCSCNVHKGHQEIQELHRSLGMGSGMEKHRLMSFQRWVWYSSETSEFLKSTILCISPGFLPPKFSYKRQHNMKSPTTKKQRLLAEWIHPGKLTWNLKMNPWKRRFLLETIIFRFQPLVFRGYSHYGSTEAVQDQFHLNRKKNSVVSVL